MTDTFVLLTTVCVGLLAALLTAGLIVVLEPILRKYALARPNARSSHTEPTPQGAGLAVIICPVIVLVLAPFFSTWGISVSTTFPPTYYLVTAILLLAATGALDDIRPLPVPVRLMLQALTALLIVTALPPDLAALPFVPFWLEQTILVFGLLWFINLTNFMDGIDGMTVVEILPLTISAILISAIAGTKSLAEMHFVMVALAGGLIGFAPFNKYKAKVFLGDVGSLPIGALSGWMLMMLAKNGFLAAALLISLYYLADATTTLFRRWCHNEKIHEAHRDHAYQIAVDNGFRVAQVTNHVLALNVALGLAALISVELKNPIIDIILLTVGCALTISLLRHFRRGEPSQSLS